MFLLNIIAIILTLFMQSGLVSALPYLAMWLLGFPISWLSDFALRKGATMEKVRKISNTIGLWIPAAALITLCLTNTNDKIILVLILVVAVGFGSGTSSGFQINHIDLSPSFAGTIMSITNSVANIFGIVAPLVCGIIVEDPVRFY
jgi:ACS family sodium-dependent inorganic phosphate cotransporter-like MFS transporter 5